MTDERTHDEMAPGDEGPPGTESTGEDICPDCSGEGRRDGDDCPTCRGTGRVITGVSGAGVEGA